jgi:hypothetical protein
MSAPAKQKMMVDEFLAWAESHEGRYELIEGEVFVMPAGRRPRRRKAERGQCAERGYRKVWRSLARFARWIDSED